MMDDSVRGNGGWHSFRQSGEVWVFWKSARAFLTRLNGDVAA